MDGGDVAPAPAAPVPAPKPDAAPAAPAKLPAAGEVTPTTTVPTAPAAQPAAAPAAPTAPAATPAAKSAEELAAEKKTADDKLAKDTKDRFDGLVKQYTLPDDLAARLPTEPEAVLPFLAAKVHQHVMKQVEDMIHSAIPSQVHNVMEFSRKETAARDEFYKAWPTLNHKEHHDKVMMVGALFRQLNPNASAEEAVQKIGRVVHEALGIALPAAGTAAAGTVKPAAAAPAAAPATFRPAAAGGAPARAPAPNDNEFAAMAESLLMDDSAL